MCSTQAATSPPCWLVTRPRSTAAATDASTRTGPGTVREEFEVRSCLQTARKL